MKYMAEFLLPGFLFPESTVRDLPEHTVEAAVAVAPEGAYCFTLYEIEEPPDLGPDFKVSPVAKNRSKRYYLGGRIYNVIEIESMGDDKRTLAANMRGNHWDEIIQCKPGNWQPFEPGDVLVDV